MACAYVYNLRFNTLNLKSGVLTTPLFTLLPEDCILLRRHLVVVWFFRTVQSGNRFFFSKAFTAVKFRLFAAIKFAYRSMVAHNHLFNNARYTLPVQRTAVCRHTD